MFRFKDLQDFFERRLLNALSKDLEGERRSEYEEELQRQSQLLDVILIPEIKLHRADNQLLMVKKEELPPEQQERSPYPDQEENESPLIKEEQEELNISQGREQLQGLDEADTKFLITLVDVKSENDDEEKPESSLLHHRLTDHMETAAGGEDCGRAEPARSSDPEKHLPPQNEVKIEALSDAGPRTVDGADDWKETRDCLNRLKSDPQTVTLQGHPEPEKSSYVVSLTEKNLFSCSVREKESKNKGNIVEHTADHSGEKPHSCSLCGKRFYLKLNLMVHMHCHLKKGDQEIPESSLLHQSGNDHMETAAGGEDCGRPEPARSSDPERQLQPEIKVMIASSDTGLKSATNIGSETLGSKNSDNLGKTSLMVSLRGKKTFTCSECGKVFSSKGGLNTHMVVHTKEKPYSCSLCGRRFGVKSNLTVHMRSHLRKGNQKKTGSSLLHQRGTSHTKTTAGREDCQKPEPARSSDPERQLQPEIKGMIASSDTGSGSIDGADGWEVTRDPVRGFESSTNIGSETLGSKNGDNLDKTSHKVSVSENRSFICSECGKGFPRKAKLNRHMVVHTKEKPFSCSVCGKTFGVKWNLTAHLHRHLKKGDREIPVSSLLYQKDTGHKKAAAVGEDGGRPEPARSSAPERQLHPEIKAMIASSDTGSGAIDGADGWERTRDPLRGLKSATNIGSETLGSKNCNDLGKTSLMVSLRGKKTFICSECGKVFSSKGGLNTHMVVHTKEKPYSCSLCGRRFGVKSNLTVHMRSHLRKGNQKKTGSSLLHQRETSHTKTTAGGEDCEKPEALRSSNIERKVQPEFEVEIKASSDTGSGSIDGADCWEETRDPLRGIKSATNRGSETIGSKNCDQLGKASHKVSVRENRSFICSECGKGFPNKAKLSRHMVVHTKEKLHSCSLCGKTFGVKWNLTAHLHRHLRKGDQEIPESSLLYQRETGNEKAAAGGEDFGRAEPANSSNPERYLPPENEVKIEASSVTGSIVGTDDCEEDKSPLQRLKSDSQTVTLQDHSEAEKSIYVVSLTEKNLFSCSVCGKESNNKGNISRHILIHTKEKPHKCPECGTGFRSREVVKHVRVHSGGKPYSCSVCGKGFRQKSSVKAHMHVHTSKKPYSCSVCGRGFCLKASLTRHILTHTNVKPHKCHECGSGFGSRRELLSHMHVHTREKPFTCSECGKGFCQKTQLTRHMFVHTPEKPYSCSFCEKAFRLKTGLKSHMRIHTKLNLHSCTKCGKRFTLKSSLYNHKFTHKEEKPYFCSICGKGFIQIGDLATHLRVHSTPKRKDCPVRGRGLVQIRDLITLMRVQSSPKRKDCPVCGKVFNYTESLYSHMFIHTKAKPYNCCICGRGFMRKKSLMNHKLVHPIEKPYSCPDCGKAFHRKRHLTVHKTIHTRGKPYSCSECGKSYGLKESLEAHMRVHAKEEPTSAL